MLIGGWSRGGDGKMTTRVMTDEEQLAYIRAQFDEVDNFIIDGVFHDADNRQVRGLLYEFSDFEEWLRLKFNVIDWAFRGLEWTTNPHYSFQILSPINPYPDQEIEGSAFEESKHLQLEPTSPRFVVRFLKSFVERFPENNKIYVMIGGISYAWFDPGLEEEAAMIQILSHDDAVMAELGEEPYDHSRW